MKLPKAHRITARQVEDISLRRQLRRKTGALVRNRQAPTSQGRSGEAFGPRCVLATASTIERVQTAIKARDSVANNKSLAYLNF